MIVALDSLHESANYIHIDDVREDTMYYCPCCKGIVKPRAYKKDVEYEVQAHFYHETGGCSEETYTHYICKTWLFEKGCKFIVDKILYEVADIEVEKTLHTSFGDYRPDIIVTTTLGKIFYFEIKVANKKTVLFAPKWDELGNDVVEVDARYFVNQKHNCDIPVFHLIYSNGECFIKRYSCTDYEDTIAKRKLEWKRQDKLNYKIQWERLDWFWKIFTDYKDMKANLDNLLNVFALLDYKDQVWCYLNIKNKSCLDHKESFQKIVMDSFTSRLENLVNKYSRNDRITFTFTHVSPLIYEVKFISAFKYFGYSCQEFITKRIRTKKGIIVDDALADIEMEIHELLSKINNNKTYLNNIILLTKLPYIRSIVPYSHYSAEHYPLSALYFTVSFEDYVFTPYIKNTIGEIRVTPSEITEPLLEKEYRRFRHDSYMRLDNMFIEYALKNNSNYLSAIERLSARCNKESGLSLGVSSDYKRVWLKNNLSLIFQYEYSGADMFDTLGDKIYNLFDEKINQELHKVSTIKHYINLVNSCKNNMWSLSYKELTSELVLRLFDQSEVIPLTPKADVILEDYIKEVIFSAMKNFIEGKNHEIRIMEV